MTHDPLCARTPTGVHYVGTCTCQLISKVRADERLVYAGGATVNTIKAVDGVTQDEIAEFLEQL